MLSFLKDDSSTLVKLCLSKEKIENLQERIAQLMHKKKPFLHQHYSMANLARDLHIHPYQLSTFINQVMHQHYNDLINDYRINYCLDLLNNNINTKLRIFEIAAACGYSNRNTFTSAFKKVTKTTPNTYISQLKGRK